ncbi:MAG: hypothetical protein KGO02_14155, partial [Alphaproteobacteria bacterium]|nr:hypothetical protein [Alphaproteobacteria bacterium]
MTDFLDAHHRGPLQGAQRLGALGTAARLNTLAPKRRLLRAAIVTAAVLGLTAFAPATQTALGHERHASRLNPVQPYQLVAYNASAQRLPHMLEGGAPFSFADLVERVAPSVVTVTVDEKMKAQPKLPEQA